MEGVSRDMDKRSKKIFIFVAVCFTIFGVCAVMAWFRFADGVVNKMRLNNFDFHVTLMDQFIPPESIGKDEQVSKQVTVKNDGDIPAFVRVLVMSVALSKENVILKAQIGREIIINDLNTAQWQYGDDGYYYYLYKLMPGEKALDLFNTVSLDPSLSSEYKDAALNIQIKTESIEANKYSYRTAWWKGYLPESASLRTIDDALQQQG